MLRYFCQFVTPVIFLKIIWFYFMEYFIVQTDWLAIDLESDVPLLEAACYVFQGHFLNTVLRRK